MRMRKILMLITSVKALLDGKLFDKLFRKVIKIN